MTNVVRFEKDGEGFRATVCTRLAPLLKEEWQIRFRVVRTILEIEIEGWTEYRRERKTMPWQVAETRALVPLDVETRSQIKEAAAWILLNSQVVFRLAAPAMTLQTLAIGPVQ